MTTFDQAIFVDARHLLDVDRRFRNSDHVVDRIEVVAEQMLLAGGASHKVVFANFADKAACALAEEFGAKSGFRMRHVAESDVSNVPSLMAAEAYEARIANPQLRLVSLVAPLGQCAPFVESLHRAQISVVVLSSEVSSATGAIDQVLALPLDPAVLQHMVADAVASLYAEGAAQVTTLELNRKLVQVQPGFRPVQYGFKNMQQLVGYMRNRCIAVDAAGVISPLSGAAKEPRQGRVESEKRAGSRSGAALAARVTRGFVPREVADLAGLSSALRDVLAVGALDAEVARWGESEGLAITPFAMECLRAVVPSYSKVKTGVGLQDICLAATSGSDWAVGRSETATADVRLFFRRSEPPRGYGWIVANTSELSSMP